MTQREYRGKSVDHGEWVYGWFHKLDHHMFLEKSYIIPSHASALYSTEVEPKTVGQYTGEDDQEGNMIYDGDVLDGSWINPMTKQIVTRLYAVAYEQGRYLAKLIGKHPYGTTMLYFQSKKSVVVGNIHDHPHLLHKEE